MPPFPSPYPPYSLPGGDGTPSTKVCPPGRAHHESSEGVLRDGPACFGGPRYRPVVLAAWARGEVLPSISGVLCDYLRALVRLPSPRAPADSRHDGRGCLRPRTRKRTAPHRPHHPTRIPGATLKPAAATRDCPRTGTPPAPKPAAATRDCPMGWVGRGGGAVRGGTEVVPSSDKGGLPSWATKAWARHCRVP